MTLAVKAESETELLKPNKRGPAPQTPAQRAESKERTRIKHNERRRRLYATDPVYAARERKASRLRLRKRYGKPDKQYDCRDYLDDLPSMAEFRSGTVEDRDVFKNEPTLTCKDLVKEGASDGGSGVFGVSLKTLTKWIATGIIPKPILKARVVTGAFGRTSQTSVVRVYHIDEVRAIIKHLGPHQSELRVVTRQHANLIEAIKNEIHSTRIALGFA